MRLANAGKLDDAVREMESVLAIERAVVGGLSEDVASSLQLLAALHQNRGDWSAARKALQDVVALREHQPDRKDWRVADAQRVVADLNRLAGMAPAQRQRYWRARESDGGADVPHDARQFEAAKAAALEALQIRRDLLGEDHYEYAVSLDNLAKLYEATGEYTSAERVLHRAREIREKVVGKDHPVYGTSLWRLGWHYKELGNYGRAEPFLRQAAETFAKTLGADDENYGASLSRLGQLYEDMGDYARAEPLLRRALEIDRKALGEDDADYATSLNNLGLLYREMGDYARAERMLLRGQEVVKRALGEDHPYYAKSLQNLAGVYNARGDNARAEPPLRRAMEIIANAVGEDHPDFALSLHNLAVVYVAIGDDARAKPLLVRALEIRKKAFGQDHPSCATDLSVLAMVHAHMGDYAGAEPLLRQALEIWKQAGGEDQPLYTNSLSNLALMQWAKGNLGHGESMSRRALEIQSAFIDRTGSGLGERPWMELLWSTRGYLNTYLCIAQQAGARPEALYRRVLDWKGASGARQANNRQVLDRPDLRPVIEELASVRARLARLSFTAPASVQRDLWRKQLDALRERKETLEADLGRRSAAYRAGRESARTGLEDVVAALPAGTALIDLIVYTHATPLPDTKLEFQSEPRLLAFIVRRDRPIVCVALGPEEPINHAVFAWRQALQTRRSDALSRSAATLGRLIWEPLRPHVADIRTVLVAPDGPMSVIPFAALPGGKPGSYLIEEVVISYVGSGREAAALLTAPGSAAAGGLLAAGAIDFRADPGRAVPQPPGKPSFVVAASERSGFPPLPGTRVEGELARDLFRRAFPDQPAVLLTGTDPTEAEIKKRLDGGRWRTVHLGTHGFFESPARVAALRAAMGHEQQFSLARKPVKDGDEAAFEMTPFLNSGIVLVGGGRATDAARSDLSNAATPQEDGILTAEEVQSLDLRGTELVVVSACDTGLGQVRYGQGVLGLQRAFLAAGARAVVASLWKVDDAATSVLMEQFYTNLWVKKLPRLEALRQAQLAVLNDPGLMTKRRAELAKERGIGETAVKLPEGGRIPPLDARDARSDPALWAAFVLSGNGG
jgi:CHAT domain-containing protein/tetratricopeptide (TPR) repeat protein